MTGREKLELAGKYWTACQDRIGKAIKAGEEPSIEDLELSVVFSDALGCRHTDGRRYFDMVCELEQELGRNLMDAVA